LDIGFVRSQTEIALLELYGDYPRGHLSRYTAIYSSLSSSYDLEFDGNTAVATPFPVTEEEDPRSAGLLDSLTTVAFEKNEKPRLRGMEVASASTQMVHSEQMAELAGPIRLFPAGTNQSLLQLKNECGYDLSDAVVIHRRASRDGKDRLRGCWLGLVRKGASVMLRWSDVSLPGKGLPYAEERRRAAQTDYHARLNVDPLLRLAFRFPDADDPLHGMRDEYRLIARIDDWLPGAAASPTASQRAGATVVLGRLRLADAPFPEVDANSPSDVTDDKSRNAYDEELEAASSP
ncbi:MAG: hypothetical protein IT424_10965, partial [Pirellulales bacterium]|nr:hypothetical protein [Pirellulales bacterium]